MTKKDKTKGKTLFLARERSRLIAVTIITIIYRDEQKKWHLEVCNYNGELPRETLEFRFL